MKAIVPIRLFDKWRWSPTGNRYLAGIWIENNDLSYLTYLTLLDFDSPSRMLNQAGRMIDSEFGGNAKVINTSSFQ